MLGDCIAILKGWVITGSGVDGSRLGLFLRGISGSKSGSRKVRITIYSIKRYNYFMGIPRSIVLEEEEYKRLQEVAKSCGLTFGEFVRMCIRFGEPHVVARLGTVPSVTKITKEAVISNK